MTETVTVKLPVPLVRKGAEPVTEIALREPTAGEMRGAQLVQVLAGEPAATAKVISRICEPHLTEAEIAALPAGSFMALWGGVMGFLSPGLTADG